MDSLPVLQAVPLQPVTAIGTNPERDSESYVLDLSYDPRETAVGESGSPPARQRRAVILGRLADPRLQILGERLLYAESPEVMDELQQSYYRAT